MQYLSSRVRHHVGEHARADADADASVRALRPSCRAHRTDALLQKQRPRSAVLGPAVGLDDMGWPMVLASKAMGSSLIGGWWSRLRKAAEQLPADDTPVTSPFAWTIDPESWWRSCQVHISETASPLARRHADLWSELCC